MRASSQVLFLLGGLLLTMPTPASAGGKGSAKGPKLDPRVARVLSEARIVHPPITIKPYESFSRTGEGPLTVYHTMAPAAAKAAGQPLKYVFFHGAGQAADCELVSRLAIGFGAAGLNMEIHSIPYYTQGGFEAALEIARTSPNKILVGGHSAGGGPTETMARIVPDRIGALVTVNAFRPRPPKGIPALHFEGQNDGGDRLRAGQPWGDKLVLTSPYENADERFVVLREGDHSARYRPMSMHDKDKARTSEDTARMNVAMGEALKAYLGELRLLEPAKE